MVRTVPSIPFPPISSDSNCSQGRLMFHVYAVIWGGKGSWGERWAFITTATTASTSLLAGWLGSIAQVLLTFVASTAAAAAAVAIYRFSSAENYLLSAVEFCPPGLAAPILSKGVLSISARFESGDLLDSYGQWWEFWSLLVRVSLVHKFV